MFVTSKAVNVRNTTKKGKMQSSEEFLGTINIRQHARFIRLLKYVHICGATFSALEQFLPDDAAKA